MASEPVIMEDRRVPLTREPIRGEGSRRRGRSCPPLHRSMSRISRESHLGGEGQRIGTSTHGPSANMPQNSSRNRKAETHEPRDGLILPRNGSRISHPNSTTKMPMGKVTTAPRSWANVARIAMTGYDLDYFTPTKVEDEFVANFPDEALAAADPLWYECLVGYFIGKKLPFQLVETALKHAWGTKLSEVKADDCGFFFLRIPDAEFRRHLLDRGPMTVARVPFILKQWDPLLELKKEDHSKVPIWIRLWNIPMVLWSARGIGGIASLIGRPLYVDQNTAHMKLLSYARVCVEISATDVRQDTVKIWMKGTTWIVDIVYKWRPISCPHCGTFGHKCNMQDNHPN
ncbi:hypothetical protein BT93_G0452 [Corymbia citriodora subsp. variegata]|nr:hypothetical protein BT93_G0452 [Corymbia citriodora subsp. variegata]